jgi:integrase
VTSSTNVSRVSIFQPAGRPNLFAKFKLNGQWVKRATPFKPGEEARAEAWALVKQHEEAVLTVRAWSVRWLAERRVSGIRDADNDNSRLNLHILPAIGDMALDEVRPKHIVDIVDKLKREGRAPRTVRNVYSVIKALFRDARIQDLCKTDPCILGHRQLGKLRDKDLGWRAGAVFSREELALLVGDERIPNDRRLLYGLLGLGMLRDGEAAGLRWRNFVRAEPLRRLVIVATYDRDTTKTETERWMPVHANLAPMLGFWQRTGWAKMMNRKPTDDDLVLPCPKPTNRGPRKPLGAMRDRHYIWKRFQADLALLGMRQRRVHDLRRTGISLAIEDGADENMLRRGTHAPPKHVMGLYTTPAWESLCEQVLKLDLFRQPKPRRTRVVQRPVPQD